MEDSAAREGGTRLVVAAAIRGDADAVRAVWQEHRRWVAAVLLAYKPRDAELEDLLQDVAMTFVKRIGELRDERAVRGWLRTVAMNTARLAARDPQRRKRRPLLSLVRAEQDVPSGAPVEESPEALVADHQEANRLMALAMDLPDSYREPLLLKCVRGMSYRQIGQTLGLPETTIETRIARGRRMLRELAAGTAAAEASGAGGGGAGGRFAGATEG